MPEIPEPINWNEVKALLEAQGKEISTIAEGFSDIHPRIVRLDKTVESLAEDMKLLKPAVQKNTKDIGDIKASIERIEKRLESAESKLPA